MTSANRTIDVFVSYSSRDGDISAQLKQALAARGYLCWRAPEDLHPGQEWDAGITEAIERCRAMLLVMTHQSAASEQVARELALAAQARLVIVPVRIHPVEIPPKWKYYLTGTHWLDAVDDSADGAVEEVVLAVERVVPRASRAESVGDGDRELRRFLELHDLLRCASALERNAIRLRDLPDITDDDLRSIGIIELGLRKRLLKAVRRAVRHAAAEPPTVTERRSGDSTQAGKAPAALGPGGPGHHGGEIPIADGGSQQEISRQPRRSGRGLSHDLDRSVASSPASFIRRVLGAGSPWARAIGMSIVGTLPWIVLDAICSALGQREDFALLVGTFAIGASVCAVASVFSVHASSLAMRGRPIRGRVSLASSGTLLATMLPAAALLSAALVAAWHVKDTLRPIVPLEPASSESSNLPMVAIACVIVAASLYVFSRIAFAPLSILGSAEPAIGAVDAIRLSWVGTGQRRRECLKISLTGVISVVMLFLVGPWAAASLTFPPLFLLLASVWNRLVDVPRLS